MSRDYQYFINVPRGVDLHAAIAKVKRLQRDLFKKPYHPIRMTFNNFIINGKHFDGELLSDDELKEVVTESKLPTARMVEKAVLKALLRRATIQGVGGSGTPPPAPPKPPMEKRPKFINATGVVIDPSPNTLNMQGYNADGNPVFLSTQSCFDIPHASRIISAALLLDDAARRGVGINDYPVGNLSITTIPVEQE